MHRGRQARDLGDRGRAAQRAEDPAQGAQGRRRPARRRALPPGHDRQGIGPLSIEHGGGRAAARPAWTAADAAVIAVVLAEQNSASGRDGPEDRCRTCSATGRLREARQAAQSLPREQRHRAEAIQQVDAAQARLDALLAQAGGRWRDPGRDPGRDTAQRRGADQRRGRRRSTRGGPARRRPRSLRAVCDGSRGQALLAARGRARRRHDLCASAATEHRPPAAADRRRAWYTATGATRAPTRTRRWPGCCSTASSRSAADRPGSRPATGPGHLAAAGVPAGSRRRPGHDRPALVGASGRA